MKKVTQTQMAKTLGVSVPYINQIFSGRHKISWPMADRLAEIFPGKTIKQWKDATPDQIRRAFSFLEDDSNVSE